MRRTSIALGAGLGALLLGAFLLANLVWSYPLARQLWRWRQPDHYRYDVLWRSAGYEEHWQVEIRNGQIVAVVGANADRLADTTWLPAARAYVVIDGMFLRIQERTSLAAALGLAFARVFPRLNHRLAYSRLPLLSEWAWSNRCADPPPLVRYDPRWGYPASVQLRRTRNAVCGFFFDFGDTMELTVDGFEPLQ
jgi:hypothetical protein